MRLVISLMFLLLTSACAVKTGATSDGAEQVAAATTAWRAAYDSRDPARIIGMYDTDAVLWGTTAKTVAPTPTAIAEYFKDAASRPTARVTFGEQHLRFYGEVGVNTGYYTFSEVRDGQTVSRPARYTLVFRNRDGKWLVVAHHSSVVP
ncbi:SgcJ/EcaC family oxidoreductase [Polaromonas jejuensis]|uniref:SgcJ/EcaC family oxidoreductase n=1 Tax=Polaromonas jejuensis TaxID=457502 RepID=A0ABW0QFV5_9BURK|nr:SgcJ/EcaC family oxidoreductase [Polaromonas jejuensis]